MRTYWRMFRVRRRSGMLHHLGLLMNYDAQAARDYLVYDRVEDRFEVLGGKGHPALVDP
jgi:hypothetical protein